MAMEALGIIVDYLSDYEVEYELLIRRVRTSRPVKEKRRLLEHEFLKEKSTPLNICVESLDFETDRGEIETTLESVTTLILEFESGSITDSLCRRIASRLNHVRGRIMRMPTSETDLDTTRGVRDELYATCLTLEADLRDRIVTSPGYSPLSLLWVPSSPGSSKESTSKVVPVCKWGLTFSGEASDDLCAFLERVKELAVARNVSSRDLFRDAVDLFSGNALIWYRSVRDRLSDWNSLEKSLKKDFLPSDYDDVLWAQIRQRFQRNDEQVVIYFALMESYFGRLSETPPEEVKVRWLRRLIRPEYVTPLALHDVGTVQQLRDLCKKLESSSLSHPVSRQISKTPISSVRPGLSLVDAVGPSASPESTSSTREELDKPKNEGKHRFRKAGRPAKVSSQTEERVRCYNCGELNHFHAYCTQERTRFCYKCGTKGVITADCTNCQPKN